MTLEKIIQLRKLKEGYYEELSELYDKMNSKENKPKFLEKYINEFFKNCEISTQSINSRYDFDRLISVGKYIDSPHFNIRKIWFFDHNVFNITITFGLEVYPNPNEEDNEMDFKKYKYVFVKNSSIWLKYDLSNNLILDQNIRHSLIWEWDEIITHLKDKFIEGVLDRDSNNGGYYREMFNIPEKYCISILNKKPKYKELLEFWDEI